MSLIAASALSEEVRHIICRKGMSRCRAHHYSSQQRDENDAKVGHALVSADPASCQVVSRYSLM